MPHGPIDLGGRPAILLSFDPDLDAVTVHDPGPIVAVGSGPVRIRGAEAAQVETRGQLPLLSVDARVGALSPEDVVVDSLSGVRVREVLAAIRSGGRVFYLITGRGDWLQSNRRGALLMAASRTLRRALGRLSIAPALERYTGRRIDPPWPRLDATLAAAEGVVSWSNAQRPARTTGAGTLRVVHYLNALGPGGAERQLTHLAAGTARAGHRVSVWTKKALAGDDGHYAPALARERIECRHVGWTRRELILPPYVGPGAAPLPESLIDHLEGHVGLEALYPLLRALKDDPPDVLHCWLDETNLLGALAGLLAGVPRIVLGLRSLNPTYFPDAFEPWFRETYAALARSPRVQLVANCQAGAADYAAWGGIPPEGFQFVYNGLELPPGPLTPDERATRRQLLGIAPDAFLVLGIFRIGSEKRPEDFLQVLEGVGQRVPGMRAFHLGVGKLETEMKLQARERGLESLQFRGRVSDPFSYLQIADATLLTSEIEGCPNVSLESQAAGVPIVLTRTGGAPETVEEDRTGFLCAVGDVEGMSERLSQLAEQPALRSEMGRAGRAFVRDRFSIERMVQRYLEVYRGPRPD